MSDHSSPILGAQLILDGLKKTAEGAALHSFIERGLRKFGDTRVEAAFLAFAGRLLERYLANPDSDPATRVRVKVIQQRLRPYLEDLQAAQLVKETLKEPELAPVVPTVDAAAGAESAVEATRAASEIREPAPSLEEKTDVTPAVAPGDDVVPIAAETILVPGESLPDQLARQMAEALTRSRDLDDLLRTSLAALENSGDAADIIELKQTLRTGIEELIDERRALDKNLSNASHGLQAMVEGQRHMEQALDKARKHSLTDELTGLPNRTAFLRQLDAEIGRARRYGFSLALAILDVDNLNMVNSRYGQAAGDTVLHTYAREIMAHFRGYDMVARYGDDEFIVLLPNTQKEGAARAMEKAQKQVAGTYINFNGQNIPLPSFSSVLTMYSHGEPPATLLKRADEALSHAKQRGPAQAVIALPAG
jgi:diguanylate cyclase